MVLWSNCTSLCFTLCNCIFSCGNIICLCICLSGTFTTYIRLPCRCWVLLNRLSSCIIFAIFVCIFLLLFYFCSSVTLIFCTISITYLTFYFASSLWFLNWLFSNIILAVTVCIYFCTSFIINTIFVCINCWCLWSFWRSCSALWSLRSCSALWSLRSCTTWLFLSIIAFKSST